MMPDIRRARKSEAAMLTAIAVRAEAFWGFDAVFMEKFETLYRVTEDFINDNPTFVLEDKGTIIGFYGLITGDSGTSLEYMYIDPPFIGKGYGRMLCDHMLHFCRRRGMAKVFLVTSPQAKGFYLKMGAEYLGEVDSAVVENRKIPQLMFTLE